MELAVILLGFVLLLAGLVGCVLPVLPGPPLSYVGLLLLWWLRDWSFEDFGWVVVAILGALTVLVTVLDLVLPVWGAKRYGASSGGVWGSVLGMLVGMIFFPPFGMLLGAFLGALAFELLASKPEADALRAAWGVFVGTIAGVGLKLAVSLGITFVYVVELL